MFQLSINPFSIFPYILKMTAEEPSRLVILEIWSEAPIIAPDPPKNQTYIAL